LLKDKAATVVLFARFGLRSYGFPGRRWLLAILAKIGRALENSVSECLHFQPLVAPEIDRASCSAGTANKSAFLY